MAAQVGLCLAWSETPKDTFSRGVAHVFSCITICQVLKKLFEHEAAVFKLLPRDSANVNALKQTRDTSFMQNAYSGAALHCRLMSCKQSTSHLEDF